MSIQKVHFGVTALLVSAILALLLLTACDSPVSPSGGESDDDVEDFGGLPSVEMVATAYMTMHHVVFPAIEGDLDWDNVAVFGSIDEETGGEIQIVVVDAVINEEDGSTVEADLSVQVDYGEIESSVAISGEATFTDFEYGIESLHFTDAMIYFTGDAVGQAAPNPPHHASGSFEIDGEAYEVTDLLHAALTAELTYTISYITTSVAFESYPDWWDDELPDGIAHSELEHDHHRVFFNSFATGDDTHAPVYNGHFDFTDGMSEAPYEFTFDGSIEIENGFIGSFALNAMSISWISSPPESPTTPPDSIAGSITSDNRTFDAESIRWLMDAVGLLEDHFDQDESEISGSFTVEAAGAPDGVEWNEVTLFAAGDRSNEIAWGYVTDDSWHGTIERGTYDNIYAEVHYAEEGSGETPAESGSWFSGEENPVETDFHVGSDSVDMNITIDGDWIDLGAD